MQKVMQKCEYPHLKKQYVWIRKHNSSDANRKYEYFGLCIPSRAWAPTERNISIAINRSQLLLSPSMKHMFLGTIKRSIEIRYKSKVPYLIMLKNQLLWIEILSNSWVPAFVVILNETFDSHNNEKEVAK